ncbi:MAG: recombination factor protein RarA [Gammaproteobacteria bacterium]|nr:MAG: recombination factor protein RarA [Gammaproteobacteria bacterium]RLA13776.1 MAG: recombination factor protein RarA [Gammaproteobacteria bacterium]RLA16904.1 MAG: recombination factor protein RarA [Gammaproteobacteria bacterium]
MTSASGDLFDSPAQSSGSAQPADGVADDIVGRPLADRMRPRSLDEFVGQQHLLGADAPLRRLIEQDALHSLVFWGPPGTGKTTLAKIIARTSEAEFVSVSAVLAGVKEIRAAVQLAKERRVALGKPTLLFVDEVHRFNKAQQDAFLPHVEDGTVTFIGATTENPSFELNNALLSRARVYVLKALQTEDLVQLIESALSDKERGLGSSSVTINQELRQTLANMADGDARRSLNLLELAVDMAAASSGSVTAEILAELAGGSLRRFDKQGEAFYDQISALHKSVRGSSPDAALYWFTRMLDGGCDPLYVGRRMIRMASEDIGNADPRALRLVLDAVETFERLGSPEGELALGQAVIYLACAAKSNASYTAYNAAMKLAKQSGSLEPPLTIRNAPTKLMKELGYGDGYRYAHDEAAAFAPGECYFPEALGEHHLYHPTERGLEGQIGQKLADLRRQNSEAGLNLAETKDNLDD